MPVSPRLQECLAGIEFVERSVGAELDCQRALKYVNIGRDRMDHPWSNRSGRYGDHVREDDRIRSGRILERLSRDGFGVGGYINKTCCHRGLRRRTISRSRYRSGEQGGTKEQKTLFQVNNSNATRFRKSTPQKVLLQFDRLQIN